jgi:hypothetical protein
LPPANVESSGVVQKRRVEGRAYRVQLRAGNRIRVDATGIRAGAQHARRGEK